MKMDGIEPFDLDLTLKDASLDPNVRVSRRIVAGILVAERAGVVVVRLERTAVRHLDVVADGREIGLVAAMPDGPRQGAEKGVDAGTMLGFDPRRGRSRDGVVVGWQAVDLVDVEDDVRPQKADVLRRLGAGDAVGLRLGEAGEIDAQRTALAAADLTAELFGLPVRHPGPAVVAAGIADRPEVEGVDAGVGRSAMAERPTA